jgi:hypothetical protein
MAFECPRCGSVEPPNVADEITSADGEPGSVTVLWECADCDYQRLDAYRTTPFTDWDS